MRYGRLPRSKRLIIVSNILRQTHQIKIPELMQKSVVYNTDPSPEILK